MKSLIFTILGVSSIVCNSSAIGQIVTYQTAPAQISQQHQISQQPNGATFVNPGAPIITNGSGQIVGQPLGSTIQHVAQPSVATPGVHQPSMRPWYQKLTDQREHDFGVVARASKQVHVFEFENNTGADLYLNNVRTSCGCTKPQILTQHVKPMETAQIQATFDTLKFYGKKGATLTVSMQKTGQYVEGAEIQFAVKGTIRRDVVMSPGQFDFQNVSVAEPSQRKANLWYAGNPNWKITDVKSTNPNLSVALKEVTRDAAQGKVNYELTVNLNEKQTAGQFSDTLTIITNDPATSGMPIEVTGTVNTVVNVAPIALGVVNQGQNISKKLIVRSPEPISIDEIKCECGKISFTPTKGKKTLHILTYVFDTSEPTEIDENITIVSTGDKQRETKVAFSAQVVASTMTMGN